MNGPEAVTISAAAVALGVGTQRVHQLLREGRLAGPDPGPGRAPAGVARVWAESLQSEVSRRAELAAGSGSRPAVQRGEDARPAGARSGMQAAREMKAALDEARDALRAERAQTDRAVAALVAVTALLEEQQRQIGRSEAVADGFSAAMTQLLVPDSPGAM